jgi:hypothetical protein
MLEKNHLRLRRGRRFLVLPLEPLEPLRLRLGEADRLREGERDLRELRRRRLGAGLTARPSFSNLASWEALRLRLRPVGRDIEGERDLEVELDRERAMVLGFCFFWKEFFFFVLFLFFNACAHT